MGGRGSALSNQELRPGLTVGQAQARLQEIQAGRAVGEVAARTYEVVANDPSDGALAHSIDSMGRLQGVDTSQLTAQVADRGALLDEADRMAANAGLQRVGLPGDRMAYAAGQQDLVGGLPKDGQVVEVIRPGYSMTLKSGETLPVIKPKVEPVYPSEPVSAVQLPGRTS